jgi:hypothetical protein
LQSVIVIINLGESEKGRKMQFSRRMDGKRFEFYARGGKLGVLIIFLKPPRKSNGI